MIMHYAETHGKTEMNYQTLQHILCKHVDIIITPTEYTSAIYWLLTHLTFLLQKTQMALYSTPWQILRRSPLNIITLCKSWPSRRGPRTQTLLSAWNIRYFRRVNPPWHHRYLYHSDLAPQIAPLRQTIVGYQAAHSVRLTCSRLRAQTSSHRKRALTPFQRPQVFNSFFWINLLNETRQHAIICYNTQTYLMSYFI
jgi:hypothetical protein